MSVLNYFHKKTIFSSSSHKQTHPHEHIETECSQAHAKIYLSLSANKSTKNGKITCSFTLPFLFFPLSFLPPPWIEVFKQ